MEREQEDNVRHELDMDFDALRDLIYAPDPSSTGSNSVPLGRSRPEAVVPPTTLPLAPEPQDNDYDQRVRELAFDKRSKPKDRTKTEEELALEEKEALEKAERRRRKRMLGLEESDSEDDGKSKGKRKRGGDDLEDDFEDDGADWTGLGAGLGDDKIAGKGKEDSGSEEDESEDDDEEEDDEEGSGEDESGSDEDDGDSEGEEGEHEDLIQAVKADKKKTPKSKSSSKELPFTFPCPSTHDEFLEIVDDVEDKDVPVVVQRIRALYHTSLGPDNKFKLQVRPVINYFFHRY